MTKLARTILAVTTAVVLAVASPCPFNLSTAAQAANQLERCADLQTDVTNGILVWSGSAQTCPNNNLIISRATFVSWIANNGSCSGTASYMIPRAQMIACTPKTFTPSGTSFSVTTKVPPSVYTLTYSVTYSGSCTFSVQWNGAMVQSASGPATLNGTLTSAYTSNGTFSGPNSCGGTYSGTVTYH